MKLFLIIPVYKVEAYLRRCVDSALAQRNAQVEILLVDDGSPDGCPAICDEYGAAHANVHVIHKANGGLSDARNAGLDMAASLASEEDFIAFLDSDDFLHPDFAARMMSLCTENQCDAAQCEYEKGEADEFSPAEENAPAVCMDAADALLGYRVKSLCTTKIYRAHIFRTLRFPLGKLNEDEFVTWRAVWAAGRIAVTDARLLYYYQRSGGLMDSIARKMKGNPHRYDYLEAYAARIAFFEAENQPELVYKTHEKACTDLILRYSEQKHLPREFRDEDAENGRYLALFAEHYRDAVKRAGLPMKRRLMLTAFRLCPKSAVLAGRLVSLRK